MGNSFITTFFVILICLFIVALFNQQWIPAIVQQTTGSAWSGNGTLAGFIVASSALFFIALILYWTAKDYTTVNI